MKNYLEHGVRIVMRDWLEIKSKDRLLIVTSDKHLLEANALKEYALKKNALVDIMIVEKSGIQVGVFFDENENIFDDYTAIIGATDYSLITTRAAKKAIEKGNRFLSLPLSVNNNKSMLSYDFITMDTKKSKMMANVVMKYISNSSMIHITTSSGTNLKVYKQGRIPGFFNGVVRDGKGYSSASFEIYVPIEENKTEGTMIVDGSLGYLGKPERSVKITFSEGKITEIDQNSSGLLLKEYIEGYNDLNMYVASEFGIGLNSYSKCEGNCYIEDESAYGTFHIGFGRNIALGGSHEASGHFDLVSLEPDIYADNRKIMQQGRFIIPEPQIY
ncbi:peptidase [Sedimentibacter sp.]|uniref:peptidase n=1 Tax=Sedimentibacter sp. TaxID=1960295 RepID=UPI0028AD6EBC|nr:peptidase [Sedimentibacter sp.]